MFAKGGVVEKLTRRQAQVLAFIRESLRANGYPPTVREICTALQLSSPSTVHAHLANLERRGFIRRDSAKPRALDLIGEQRSRAHCLWWGGWPPARRSSRSRTSRI